MYTFYILSCIYVVYGSPYNDKIDQTLKDTIQCKSEQVVDLVVSVVRSDRVLLEGGYTNRNNSITRDTVFQIASLSKAFASTLLVKLIEENTKYSLDTSLKTILNKEDIFNDSLRSEYTTVRDILSHKTGVPQNNRIRLDNNVTRRNVIERFKYLKPTEVFRGSYIYSSPLYGVVTHLAEVIGGDSWENLVKKHLFDPLGMTSSTFITTANLDKIDIAQGYIEYYGELYQMNLDFSRQYGELCGSGGVLTTAHDMTKWMQFYLHGGKLPNGERLVSKEAFKNIITPVNVISNSYTQKFFIKPKFPVTNSQTGYALGWRSGSYRGYKMTIHTGSTYGYRAMLSWYPDVDLGIFTVMTGNDYNYFYRQTLHNYIFDVYTDHIPYLNVSTICSYPQPWVEKSVQKTKPDIRKDRTPSRPRTEYYGVYHNPAYGNIEIKEHKDNNKLKLIYGYTTFVLYPKLTADEFYGDSVGIATYLFNYYTFKFDDNGGSMSLEIPSFESRLPPVFYKQYHTSNGCKSFYITAYYITIMLVFILKFA